MVVRVFRIVERVRFSTILILVMTGLVKFATMMLLYWDMVILISIALLVFMRLTLDTAVVLLGCDIVMIITLLWFLSLLLYGVIWGGHSSDRFNKCFLKLVSTMNILDKIGLHLENKVAVFDI